MTDAEQEFHRCRMSLALLEAEKAEKAGEVPTGCVIIHHNSTDFCEGIAAPRILAKAHNQTEMLKDPTAHAEILAITQAAAAIGDWRLTECVLYVTKEPCAMCAGAIVLARIPVVVWGLSDPNRGGQSLFQILSHPNLNHRPRLCPGVMEKECREAFQAFFRARRIENGN